MLKINLLNSVTERQGGAIVAVDRTVGSPSSRLAVMSLAVAFLLAAVVGWDVISTQRAKAAAEEEKAHQEQIARELEAVMKEQKELEDRIKAIDARIDAIKRLRASQAGPSAVLEALRERIAMLPGLYLQSVEQKGEVLEIKGNSPSEDVVTQFGRSLEFSDGLFSNLNIETARKEMQNNAAPVSVKPGAEQAKVNVVEFTIKTAYTPGKASGANNPSPTTASSTTPAAPSAPVQVAKN